MTTPEPDTTPDDEPKWNPAGWIPASAAVPIREALTTIAAAATTALAALDRFAPSAAAAANVVVDPPLERLIRKISNQYPAVVYDHLHPAREQIVAAAHRAGLLPIASANVHPRTIKGCYAAPTAGGPAHPAPGTAP